MRGLDSWIEGDRDPHGPLGDGGLARTEDRLVSVGSSCPFCGDHTVVSVLPEDVEIIAKMGRLCSLCYELQERIR